MCTYCWRCGRNFLSFNNMWRKKKLRHHVHREHNNKLAGSWTTITNIYFYFFFDSCWRPTKEQRKTTWRSSTTHIAKRHDALCESSGKYAAFDGSRGKFFSMQFQTLSTLFIQFTFRELLFSGFYVLHNLR